MIALTTQTFRGCIVDFSKYVLAEIPFKIGGRGLDGIDCWGLAVLFYKEQLGLEIPEYDDVYKRYTPLGISKYSILKAYQDWECVTNPRNGDIVLCKNEAVPMHVGIYKEHGKMLHIEMGKTPVIAGLEDNKWRSNVLGYYRLKG